MHMNLKTEHAAGRTKGGKVHFPQTTNVAISWNYVTSARQNANAISTSMLVSRSGSVGRFVYVLEFIPSGKYSELEILGNGMKVTPMCSVCVFTESRYVCTFRPRSFMTLSS